MTEREIDELAAMAVNAACLYIQTDMGIKTGDVASHVFSDGVVEGHFKSYIKTELAYQRATTDAKKLSF